MPTLTITVMMNTDDELDDSMALLESQVAQALGWIGDVQTVDIAVDDEPGDEDEDDLDDQLTAMIESDDDIEWED